MSRRPAWLLAVLLAVLPASTRVAADSAKERKVRRLCEVRWPRGQRARAKDTRACIRYWFETYLGADAGHSPVIDGETTVRFTAAELSRMAAHVQKSCGKQRCAEATPAGRTAAFFEGAAAAHFSLRDASLQASIEPLLGKLLEGKAIQAKELEGWSALTLWRLRHAVYARHGRVFRHADLQRFFYGKRPPGEKTTILPRTPDRRYQDSRLDDTDRKNLALVREAERLRERGR